MVCLFEYWRAMKERESAILPAGLGEERERLKHGSMCNLRDLHPSKGVQASPSS